MLCSVFAFVVDLCGDIGTGILMQGFFNCIGVAFQTKLRSNSVEGAQTYDLRKRFSVLVNTAVDDKGIELVGKLAGLTIAIAIGDLYLDQLSKRSPAAARFYELISYRIYPFFPPGIFSPVKITL